MPVIVAMAGLPGVGKSTLAHAVADASGAVVLDKDLIRASLFPPSYVDYTVEQDDFCVDVMYRTAGWLFRRDPATVVILDGRTYTRVEQVAALKQAAATLDAALRIIECTCAEPVALGRLDDDRRTDRHPAANRDAVLYQEFLASADPIDEPRLVVDTGRPLSDCVAECLEYLGAPTIEGRHGSD
ncbi:MAG: AAA family ATPase [Sciscionella sp.]